MIRQCLIFVSALILYGNLQAQEIKLPEKLPELKATEMSQLGTLDAGLAVGQKPAGFTVNSHLGESVSLDSLLQDKGPLLVVFYRGGWCPYCNVQIRQLAEAWPEFKKRGITPVLVSADKPDASAMAQATYKIPFPVLSDPDLKAHAAFDVIIEVDDATVDKYRDYGIVLEDWSGRDHHKIAAPGIFLLDSSGQVQWAHVSKDYRTRPSVQQLLAMLDARD